MESWSKVPRYNWSQKLTKQKRSNLTRILSHRGTIWTDLGNHDMIKKIVLMFYRHCARAIAWLQQPVLSVLQQSHFCKPFKFCFTSHHTLKTAQLLSQIIGNKHRIKQHLQNLYTNDFHRLPNIQIAIH